MVLRQQQETPPGVDPEGAAAFQEFLAALGSGGAEEESRYPGPVYMGDVISKVRTLPKEAWETGRTETTRSPRWVSGEEAIADFNAWEEKRRRDFIAQAKVGGLMPADGGMVEGAKLWRMLVEEASFYGSRDQKVSPWDILSTYVKDAGGPDAVWQRDPANPDFEVNRLTGERRYVGPQFKTTTQQRTDFTDPATAAAIATAAFQQLMGRDPGAGELGQFASALQAAEAANPVSSTTTTEYDPVTGEAIGSDTVTEGGLDAAGRQHLAQQQVKEKEEYGVVQAATTYSDALEQAVWGAPSLGG